MRRNAVFRPETANLEKVTLKGGGSQVAESDRDESLYR